MKIQPLSQFNTTSFNAGKTTVFTDFDGSYMPFKHHDVCNSELFSHFKQRDSFNKIFQGYANFLQKAQQDIEFIITTGRSKPEYDYFIDKVKKLGLFYQSPSRLITRDGNDYYCFQNGEFLINKVRQQNIEQQTNWNKQKIENDLEKILQNSFRNICIVNTPINKNKFDYEDQSLEHRLEFLTNKEKMHYASFTNGDNLFIEIALNENFDIAKIYQVIDKYIKENNIKAKVNMYNEERSTYLPQYEESGSCKLKPGKLIRISPLFNNESITKLNDVKKELEFNIKNRTDDLVVVVGDAGNDEVMLNPLNYLSIYGYNKEQDYNKILSDNEALELIAQMPFAAIIVGEDKSLDNLRKLGLELEQKGIKKIYTYRNQLNGFLPQLKRAISDYGKQNEEFKYSMNTQLFKEVLSGGDSYDY